MRFLMFLLGFYDPEWLRYEPYRPKVIGTQIRRK